MYILLSGRPPFDGDDDNQIIKKVKMGSYSTNIPELKSISRDCIDLLKKLLTFDPTKRITAEEALNHPWIKRETKEHSGNV